MILSKDPEFSRLFTVEELHEGEIKLDATKEERAALSKRFDIESIQSLEANAIISDGSSSIGSNNITLNVSFNAIITQKCVATLALIRNEINSAFDLELGVINDNNTDNKVLLEEFRHNEVDFATIDTDTSFNLGELVSQYLGLEIDPFPRSKSKSDEVSSYLHETSTEYKNNPFSVLRDLKKIDL